VLRVFLRVIAQSLHSNSPGAVNMDKATLHMGAVAFMHSLASSGAFSTSQNPPIVRPHPTVRVAEQTDWQVC